MLRTPSIVWPIFNPTIHERQMLSIQRSRWITFRLLSVFLTASKDFFQTFDENIRWFDARLYCVCQAYAAKHSHLYLQAVKLEIWQRRVWVYSFISPRLLDSVFVSLNQKQ
jgi:hypothetical protein